MRFRPHYPRAGRFHACAVQLRGRRGARLGVLRPVQAPGRHLRRPRRLRLLLFFLQVYVFFFIDCRGRRGIDPPVSQNYFGTCITGCLAKATARDLLAVDGFAAATAAVQREVRRAAEDPLALWDWMDLLSWMPMDRLVNISGSPRYPAYEVADFGWGAPSRTELITMNNCGQVVLVAAKGGGGSVQASVCMHPDHMGAFKSHFLNSLSG